VAIYQSHDAGEIIAHVDRHFDETENGDSTLCPPIDEADCPPIHCEEADAITWPE
jgi:hypothetical protein